MHVSKFRVERQYVVWPLIALLRLYSADPPNQGTKGNLLSHCRQKINVGQNRGTESLKMFFVTCCMCQNISLLYCSFKSVGRKPEVLSCQALNRLSCVVR